MVTKIDKRIEELFKRGAHLGHRKNYIHPASKKYIYKIEKGISIIDLTKTTNLLDKAKAFLCQLAKEKKIFLTVITKKNLASFAQKICQNNQLPYITFKWPAGLLTNFETLLKNIEKLKTMKEEKEKGTWSKFVKHEQLKLQKELNRLNKYYGGIIQLKKLPDALFIVDIKREKNAVIEANKKKIPIVAIVDTNANPDKVTYPIPANDDTIESVEYIVKELIENYIKSKKT